MFKNQTTGFVSRGEKKCIFLNWIVEHKFHSHFLKINHNFEIFSFIFLGLYEWKKKSKYYSDLNFFIHSRKLYIFKTIHG